jgi:hypothetical protein
MIRLILALIILPLFTKGQNNLVPNPSFEDTLQCPTNQAQLYVCVDWVNPTACSPDYFHSCNPPVFSPPSTYFPNVGVPENGGGFQLAHTGEAYAGLFAFSLAEPEHNIREYIQVELTDTLTQGTKYIVSFYASLADKFWYSVNTLGAYLSVDSISRNDMLRFEVIPQILNDSTNPLISKDDWMLVTDTFVSATGGERFITIGNFNDDAESDTLLLTTGIENYYHAYYFIDDVSVVVLDTHVGLVENKEIKIALFPNPAINTLTIENHSMVNNHLSFVSIYDLTGRQIGEWQMVNSKKTIDVSNFAEGVYIIQLQSQGGLVSKKFIKR